MLKEILGYIYDPYKKVVGWAMLVQARSNAYMAPRRERSRNIRHITQNLLRCSGCLHIYHHPESDSTTNGCCCGRGLDEIQNWRKIMA